MIRLLSLFFVIAISSCGLIKSNIDTVSIPVKSDDIQIKVDVVEDHDYSIKADRQKTYYWLKSKEIHFTEGGFSGQLLHGNYESHYQNNQLKEQGEFNRGLKIGKWTEWYENGKIKLEYNYRHGLLHGKSSKYNELGQTILIGNYKKGLKHGEFINYENNEIISVTNFKKGEEIIPKSDAELVLPKDTTSTKEKS